MLVLVAHVAAAQLSAVGAPSSVSPASGTAPVRWPDVAYDPKDDVFLAVSGAGQLEGLFVSGAGTPEGAAFVVNDGTLYGQAPRVVYASAIDAFLVTWHETIGSSTRIRGRLIRHGLAPLTGNFDISSLTTNWEMGAAVAYSPQSHEFLVAWQGANSSLRGQRVSEAGAAVGAELELDASPRYHRDPAVSWTPTTDEFLVAYAGCNGNNDCFVAAQRVKAGTGALVGGPLTLEPSVQATYIPEIAFNAFTRQSLVVWHAANPGDSGFRGRRVNTDGSLEAAVTVSTLYGSYDANGLAWNPVSNTFAFITHSTGSQDAVLELSAVGAPLDTTGAMVGPVSASGNFNPRIAARGNAAEWLAVTSTAFNQLTTQKLLTGTREPTGRPVDAGAVDAGTIAAEDAGAPSSDAGTAAADAGTPAGDAGSMSTDGGAGTGNLHMATGCGCASSEGAGLLALAVALMIRRHYRSC